MSFYDRERGRPGGLRGRNEIFDTIPLAVGEIGRVGLVLHTPSVPESSS